LKIYISGVITGTDDFMERFSIAQKKLERDGHEVVNPALVNSNLPKSTTYDEYMDMSFCMLKMCDAIYLLDGWKSSRGAKLELIFAVLNDKTILYEVKTS
jgi:hypothetical protein